MKYTKHEEYLLKEWVIERETKRIGKKTTVVCLRMENDFEVIGTNACLHPEDYFLEEEVLLATKDALMKVNEIVAYFKNSNEKWF